MHNIIELYLGINEEKILPAKSVHVLFLFVYILYGVIRISRHVHVLFEV